MNQLEAKLHPFPDVYRERILEAHRIHKERLSQISFVRDEPTVETGELGSYWRIPIWKRSLDLSEDDIAELFAGVDPWIPYLFEEPNTD